MPLANLVKPSHDWQGNEHAQTCARCGRLRTFHHIRRVWLYMANKKGGPSGITETEPKCEGA